MGNMFLFESLPATVNDDIGLLLLDEVQIWVEHLLEDANDDDGDDDDNKDHEDYKENEG